MLKNIAQYCKIHVIQDFWRIIRQKTAHNNLLKKMHNSGSPAFTKDSDKVAYTSRVADQKHEAPFSHLLSQVVSLAIFAIWEEYSQR